MAHRSNRVILISMLVLVAIAISACTQPYSQVPAETPTVIPSDSLFVSPLPSADNPMAMVEELATASAIAGTSVALTAGTPLAPSNTAAAEEGITPGAATEVPTQPQVMCTAPVCAAGETLVCPAGVDCSGGCNQVCAANTATATTQASTGGSSTSSCGSSYTLQSGEFPFCIARRCDVDPAELLALNGLSSGDIYYPNLTLKIPQNGRPFPGTRALNPHPSTFTVGVTSGADTIYEVACYYGDVEPSAIASANGLSVGSPLTAGQQLSIP